MLFIRVSLNLIRRHYDVCVFLIIVISVIIIVVSTEVYTYLQ